MTTERDPARTDLSLLLDRCARRDGAALRALYAATAPTLYGRLSRLLRDDGLAQDALQDVYATVWMHAGRYDPARGAPMTWLAAIARNRALGVIQKRRREYPLEEESAAEEFVAPDPRPDEALAISEDGIRLAACLGALEPATRDLIRRAFYEEVSHAALALQEGRPLGTIKSVIRRGLIQLRRCLDGVAA